MKISARPPVYGEFDTNASVTIVLELGHDVIIFPGL
jgi:hypothetical protein